MTYKEYLVQTLNRFFVSPSDVEILMLNQKIDPDAEVDVHTAKMAMYNEISFFIPLVNMSEGGTSVTWITKNVLIWYSLLASDLGMPDLLNNNTVEDLTSNW